MKNSRKVLSLALAATMLSGTTTAFAMPADTVVMGDKAFEIGALGTMTPELQVEVNAAILGADSIYYNIGGVTTGFLNADGDVAMTGAAQTVLKNVVLTKADGSKETFANFEDESGTGVVVVNLTAYNAALAAKVQADYTAASWTAYQVVVAANVVTVANTQVQVDAATAAIVAAQANLVSNVVTLAVESVSAINAKQVQVVFNTNVVVADLTKANFTVTEVGTDAAGKDRMTDSATSTNGITGATVNTSIIKAGSDAKTVILTVDNGAKFANGKTISVTVTGVKNGTVTMADVTKTAVLSDTAVPTVVSAVSTASNKVRVIFSEPVYNGTADDYATDIKTGASSAANFTINNGAVAITTAVRDSENPNAVIITTTSDLSAGTSYTVKVNDDATNSNIKDYSDYKVMTDATIAFTHTIESASATVTAEAKSETKVRLTFNKAVTIPTVTNVEFRYGYNATGSNKVIADSSTGTLSAAITGSNGTQYDLTFPSPMTMGAGTIYINYTNVANAAKTNVIVDGFGNIVADDTAVSFTVNSDTTVPTATVAYKAATSIDVTFSETVTGATTSSNYEVKDKDGKTVAITGVTTVDATKNQYRLTVTSMSAGGNYTVKVTDGIKDISVNQNKFVANTVTIVAPDTMKPTVTSLSQNATGDKLYVYYSEEMGAASVDLNSYRLSNGSAQYSLPTGTTITQSGSTATISLPKTLTAIGTDNSTTINNLFIGAVKDTAGNQIATMTNHSIGTYSANFTATVTKSKIITGKQISFVVNRQLKSVDATKIKKTNTGSTAATSATFVNNADGTATVTANYASATTFDTYLNSQILHLDASALTDTNDLKNSELANHTILADYAAPTIVSAVTKDATTVNGKIDTIEVKFSEELYTGSVQESDFTVAGYTITGVSLATDVVTNNTVKISVLEKGTKDTGAAPAITLVGEVEDNVTVTADQASRNKLGVQPAVTATDGTGLQVAVTADKTVVKDTDSVIFTATFTEAVKSTTVPKIELTTGETLVATNMTKVSDTVWTYTHAMTDGASDTVKAIVTVATDVAGNALTGDFTTAKDTTVVADNTKPDVAAATVTGNIVANNSVQANTITVKVTEKLQATTANAKANWTATNNGAGITYTIASAAYTEATDTVVLTLATVDATDIKTFITNIDAAADVKVTMGAGVLDVVGNIGAAAAVTAKADGEVVDATAGTVTAALVKTDATHYVVSFSEKVDTTTAGDKVNYTLGGTGLGGKSVSTSVLQADGKTVVLTLDGDPGTTIGQTIIVTPTATITDVSGVVITSSAATYTMN